MEKKIISYHLASFHDKIQLKLYHSISSSFSKCPSEKIQKCGVGGEELSPLGIHVATQDWAWSVHFTEDFAFLRRGGNFSERPLESRSFSLQTLTDLKHLGSNPFLVNTKLLLCD